MAREIWIKADVYGLISEDEGVKPLARCGLHETGGELIFAPPVIAQELRALECWARGIINSSNTALVEIKDSYAPLGKADGEAHTEFGMQVRGIRNEFSRDHPLEYLSSRSHAEKMCLLKRNFRGTRYNLAEILAHNNMKPEYMDVRKLSHLAALVDAYAMRNIGEVIELPKNI